MVHSFFPVTDHNRLEFTRLCVLLFYLCDVLQRKNMPRHLFKIKRKNGQITCAKEVQTSLPLREQPSLSVAGPFNGACWAAPTGYATQQVWLGQVAGDFLLDQQRLTDTWMIYVYLYIHSCKMLHWLNTIVHFVLLPTIVFSISLIGSN